MSEIKYELAPDVTIAFETATEQQQAKAQRVALVASMGGNYEHLWRTARAAGISDAEIREGLRRAIHEENLRQLGTRIYGDPNWGSWPAGALEKLRQMYPYKEQ